MTIYFEDFAPGQVRESPARRVTKAEILAFAQAYDPQPFHTDEEAARRSIFGGLLASGWHTTAIFMRLLWEAFLKDTASLGSPGVDEVRWLRPVRPGDTLRVRFTVVETIPSRSKPDRGVVKSVSEVLNQHGEVVMTVRGLGMFGRRPPPRRTEGGPREPPRRRRSATPGARAAARRSSRGPP